MNSTEDDISQNEYSRLGWIPMKHNVYFALPVVSLPAALNPTNLRSKPRPTSSTAHGKSALRGKAEIGTRGSSRLRRFPAPQEAPDPNSQVRAAVNLKRHTKLHRRLSILLFASASIGGLIIYSSNQSFLDLPATTKSADAIIDGPSVLNDASHDIMRFFVYEPPAKGREFVQTGRFGELALDITHPQTPARITDRDGHVISSPLLMEWLNHGGYVVVTEAMGKFFIRQALDMNSWNLLGRQIVTFSELTAMTAKR